MWTGAAGLPPSSSWPGTPGAPSADVNSGKLSAFGGDDERSTAQIVERQLDTAARLSGTSGSGGEHCRA
jgi:hypothetical protein